MTHISIIIVHYNTPKETNECLLSLNSLLCKNFEYSVVVVDNGSRIPYQLPSKVSKRKVTIVRSDSNLGFTGGNNLGIYQAVERFNPDYIGLLNSDTVVDRRFLNELHQALVANPTVGLISPKIYFYPGNEYFKGYARANKGNILWYGGGSIDWRHLAAYHRGVDEVDRGHFDSQKQSDFATGCCVLVRREVLEKIGTLDKRYFLYFEDVDFSVRAVRAGYEVGFAPKAVVWHKNAGSSGGSGSKIHQYYQARNRFYFALKHGSLRAKMVALKLMVRTLIFGSRSARIGVLHAVFGQFGKQQVS